MLLLIIFVKAEIGENIQSANIVYLRLGKTKKPNPPLSIISPIERLMIKV